MTTIESEHLGRVIDAKIAGQNINFTDINSKKAQTTPTKPLSQMLEETTPTVPPVEGADFIQDT